LMEKLNLGKNFVNQGENEDEGEIPGEETEESESVDNSRNLGNYSGDFETPDNIAYENSTNDNPSPENNNPYNNNGDYDNPDYNALNDDLNIGDYDDFDISGFQDEEQNSAGLSPQQLTSNNSQYKRFSYSDYRNSRILSEIDLVNDMIEGVIAEDLDDMLATLGDNNDDDYNTNGKNYRSPRYKPSRDYGPSTDYTVEDEDLDPFIDSIVQEALEELEDGSRYNYDSNDMVQIGIDSPDYWDFDREFGYTPQVHPNNQDNFSNMGVLSSKYSRKT